MTTSENGTDVVVLDPSAPFVAAIRRLLPQTTSYFDLKKSSAGGSGRSSAGPVPS